MQDRAQLFCAHFAQLAIDRHATARVYAVRRFVVIRDEFVIRIFHFKKSAPPALPLAVEQHALTLWKRVLKISLIPPVSAYLARFINARKLEDAQPSALDRI